MNQLNKPEHESKSAAVEEHSRLSPQQEPLPESSSIDQFVRAVQGGIQSWLTAGRILVKLKFIDPQVFKKITTSVPWLTPDLLWSFHRIGEGKLYPQILLLKQCPAESEILRSPIEVQQLVCEEPIAVVVSVARDGQPKVEKRWLTELGKSETKLVFHNGHIRTPEQQVAKLKIDEITPAKIVPKPPEEEPTTFANSIGDALPKKLVSIGWFKLSWLKGVPVLEKGEGRVPQRAQNVTCLSLTPEETVLDFKVWMDK